jgi:hypothetical protein
MQMLRVLVLALGLGGCGRYAAPIPPESLAPVAVSALSVLAEEKALQIKWESPQTNLRGEELGSLDGYRVYRAKLNSDQDFVIEQPEFALIGSITDTHLVELEKKKDLLIASGKPSRRASVDPSLTRFNFTDADLIFGQRYLYKVVPLNQGGIEGSRFALTQVLWQGTQSKIQTLAQSELRDSLSIEEEQ